MLIYKGGEGIKRKKRELQAGRSSYRIYSASLNVNSCTARRHRCRSDQRTSQDKTSQDKPCQARPRSAHLQPPLPPGPVRPRSARPPSEHLPAVTPPRRPRRAPRSAAGRAQAALSRHIAHPRRHRYGTAAAPNFRTPAHRFRGRGGAGRGGAVGTDWGSGTAQPGAGTGRAAAMAVVDAAFPRSARGALKISRMVVAVVTFLCFAASRSHEAYTALAVMEALITLLFFLLYLLKLDKKLTWLFWPLADIFNSVVAALFLLIVALFALIIKTNHGTLAGGVFGLVLLVLCVVDAVVLFQKISISRPRERNAPAK
uniref:Chemokine-like factor n=2 Tax=Coturnix japonica TaxID=93934 RepID=A0A8C2TUL8_COTJA